jgi:hypothetical protein
VLCPGCRQRSATARPRAEARARHWLRAQHPEQYANLYAAHLAKARAEDPEGSATTVRDRARGRALGELQRSYRNDYRQRYEVELARAHTELDQQAQQRQVDPSAAPRVPYWQERDALAQRHAHANAAARLRALLWLTERHPDSTAEVYRAQAVRLPLNPADRTPERRRALAWATTLDRLARLHPGEFHSRYAAELAAIQQRQHDPWAPEVGAAR